MSTVESQSVESPPPTPLPPWRGEEETPWAHPSDPEIPPDPNADLSGRITTSFMVGVYVALNAIEDAYLLVEGPNCTHMKAQYVQGNHDLLSSLTDVCGYHRVTNTDLYPSMLINSREAPLAERLKQMAAHEVVGLQLLTTMPMASITAADYRRLCRGVAEDSGKPVVHIPGLSLQGDWLDGYAESLKALAKDLPLPAVDPEPNTVAIVGYLWDRNEFDHHANVAQLRRLCEACGLELASVWLCGQKSPRLAEAARAATIIALPYGTAAAHKLADRTGAEVVELPLPFGVTATESFVRALAERSGRRQEAQDFIDSELSRLMPRLEWVIPLVFQNTRAGYIGDPHLVGGLQDILRMLGSRLCFGVITNISASRFIDADTASANRWLLNPLQRAFSDFVGANMRTYQPHLMVTNACDGGSCTMCARVEFGFPCYYTHTLYERPFLGFEGAVAFIDTLAQTLRTFELQQHSRQRNGASS